jgi:formyltetrahydrofolate-dependent phosphoribosylglycinamide formyltransferase
VTGPHLPRLVLLASGNGTNVQAVLDACASGEIGARVVAVVSNHTIAPVLTRACAGGVPAVGLPSTPGEARADYDTRLADTVARYEPTWIVLAGWMRILTMAFLGRFPNRVVNLHPALPGAHPGTNAIRRAFDLARNGGPAATGVMVHLVPDEGVDDGPLLSTCTVPILASDSLDELESRMHAAEHELLVATLARLCATAERAVIAATTRPVVPTSIGGSPRGPLANAREAL